MNHTPHRLIVALAIGALLVVTAGCDNGAKPETTTPGASTTAPTRPDTTTTVPTITSIPPDQIPGTHSASITDELDTRMRSDIGDLILAAEQSRALPFLQMPTVTILDEADFRSRVAEQVSEDLDPAEISGDQALFELMGMLDGDTDLGELLIDLYTEQVLGFYDGSTKEIVVPSAPDGFSAYQRITLVHELVHALTDQHFEFDPEFERRDTEGNIDDAAALLALVEGDATYQQFLYIEDMDPAEAIEAALEALSFESSTLDAAPRWVGMDLAFPYEQGLIFIQQVISDGGLKAVDEAYQDPPDTTEQILEPRKYLRREDPEPLDPVTVTLPGWEIHEDASWGEWGVRMILTDTVSPGMVTQAAAGWGNDSYRVLLNGDEVAMAWSYLAESEEDAEDLVNALIAHARDRMGATSSKESGGGLLLEGSGIYVFIDRIDDRFVFVASTDAAAGGSLRSQMGV
ncbi:MAG: hypothetical protein R2823_09585 [Acidimicrobiia bacterium]